ncbi:RraA family protein [Fusibacter bizertensis]
MSEQINFPDLIPEHLMARIEKLNSAQLCDGMEGLGILRNGCMDAGIMPVDENMKVIGTAFTIATEEGDNFPIHAALYHNKPGYVLVIDGQGYDQRAYMGDLMISAAKAVGLNGVVIDGFVRDRLGLKEIGLPVFSKGFMQRSPIKKGPGEVNTTINCGGVTVKPGDLIFGDYDGITVVPREHLEIVIERAEKKNAYEIERRRVIDEYEHNRINELPLPEIAPQWVLDLLNKAK